MDRLQAMKIFERVVEEGGFAAGERYWPDDMATPRFYEPVPRGLESRIGEKLAELRRLVMRFAATWADRVAEWRATVEERRARGGPASWQNTGPAAQTRQKATCRGPPVRKAVRPLRVACPDRKERRGKRQSPTWPRHQGIKGLQARRTPHARDNRTSTTHHLGMPHKAPCPGAMQFPGSPPYSNRAVACGHPIPKLHRHGPGTGEENPRYKKSRQGNLAG